MTFGPRSLHVVSSLRLSAGGPTRSVTQLCEALNRVGAPAEIATITFSDDLPWNGVTQIHKFQSTWPAKVQRSPQLRDFLMHETSRFDVVHVHGLWQWPGLYARTAAEAAGVPLVISPRGMIEPWSMAQKPWTKWMAMQLWERRNLESAALFHATSIQEANSVWGQRLRQPIAILPNGIEAPKPACSKVPTRPTALFLSRLHPKKGVDILLSAWARNAALSQDWDLLIAGPDEGGYGQEMAELADRLGLCAPRVRFLGEVHGMEKWELLAQADLFLLPSHSENFGNVVLEALSQGTPVLTTHGTPWSALEREGCGWWVPLEGFESALQGALATSKDQLRAMGSLGSRWAHSSFGWNGIAKSLALAYGWIRDQGPIPESVEFPS